jgi:hypothetical protein
VERLAISYTTVPIPDQALDRARFPAQEADPVSNLLPEPAQVQSLDREIGLAIDRVPNRVLVTGQVTNRALVTGQAIGLAPNQG